MVEKTIEKKAKSNKKDSVKFYGTGRRKSAIARVWVIQGKGDISINNKSAQEYLGRETLETKLILPLKITNTLNNYDIKAFVKGGGIAGQADAIIHGISRALLMVNPDFRKPLKLEGLITRDPREKESKKYGRKKARKGYTYRKR